MTISIVIPTKDRPDILAQTLVAACQAVQEVNAEIIVVNDSVQPVSLPAGLPVSVRVVRNPKAGVASARNYGARQAKGSLLLFLDDDMLIRAEDIQTTLALHQTRRRCCINLNWVYPPDRLAEMEKTPFGRYLIHYGFTSLKGWNRGNPWNDHELFATEGITSQYLSFWKDDFDASGGYNETFPHAGFEDYEFAKRLRAQGFTFYIYPHSRLLHNEADRQHIAAWLARRRRGGQTRRVAAELGHPEVALHYPAWKKAVLMTVGLLKPALTTIISVLPSLSILDTVRFRLISILLAEAIYSGYTQSGSRTGCI